MFITTYTIVRRSIMLEYIIDNKQWLFSGLGIFIIGAVFKTVYKSDTGGTITASSNNNINVINNINATDANRIGTSISIDNMKDSTRILFIDDDVKFKVVKILQKSGWIHAKSVKDIYSLDNHEVKDIDIFFVDIQGVGIALGFKDEGLGLALAIKKKYPDKKVIIYSAESKGERFHEALRKADTFLPKNAEPYEFLQIVENYSLEIKKGTMP